MGLDFKKGPDWSISQRVAALLGLFVGAGVSHVLLNYHLISQYLAAVVVVVAIVVPPVIIGRWQRRKKGLS